MLCYINQEKYFKIKPKILISDIHDNIVPMYNEYLKIREFFPFKLKILLLVCFYSKK